MGCLEKNQDFVESFVFFDCQVASLGESKEIEILRLSDFKRNGSVWVSLCL